MATPTYQWDYLTNVYTASNKPAKVGDVVTSWSDLRKGISFIPTGMLVSGTPSNIMQNVNAYSPMILESDGLAITALNGANIYNNSVINGFTLRGQGGGTVPVASIEMWFKIVNIGEGIDLLSWSQAPTLTCKFHVTPTSITWHAGGGSWVSSPRVSITWKLNVWYHFYYAFMNNLSPCNHSLVINGSIKTAASQWGGLHSPNCATNSTVSVGRCLPKGKLVVSDLKIYSNVYQYTWDTTFTPTPRTIGNPNNTRLFTNDKSGINPYYYPFLKGRPYG